MWIGTEPQHRVQFGTIHKSAITAQMKKRTPIAQIPIFLLIVFMLVSPIQAALGDDKRPNIVLVLMDNFGYGE
ncbi:MAG TPA: hypothetical protein DD457_06160, partial [Gammaproteobacteria bacterium]|nr:hypothetical protein [Gammaproteobacteria bacterium]